MTTTPTPDFRALCAELANELDNIWQCLMDNRRLLHPLANDVRAALATPPPEPPTDEELVTFLYVIDPEDELSPLAMVRAALERWGHG